jgi:cytochrome c553
MTQRSSPVVAAVIITIAALGLSACQTTPSPTTPAAKPAEAKPAEAPKPITPEMARNLANNCFTCHGPDGRSPGTIPSINTMNADTIASRLKNFKTGTEPSTVMGRQAKGYSDAEIDAVAKYIAGLRK